MSVMGRPRGQHRRQPIPGDPDDRFAFPTLVDDFCDELAVHGQGVETVRVARCHLAKLAGWLATEGVTHPADVTTEMLERYQRYLHEVRKPDGSPLTLTTQGACIGPVKRFYEWGAKHGRIPHNPALGLRLPPREQRLPRAVLTFAEADRVMRQPDTRTARGLRDRAILETFYSTGMRRGELGRLLINDLDLARGAVYIRQAKGHKDRVVPIGTRALAWIDAYLTRARPLLAHTDDTTLFLNSEDGGPLGLHRLSGLVACYVDHAGISKHGGCHLFRHTVATLMLESGADIRYVQAMLGHASLSSTQIYTHVSVAALQAVHTATFANLPAFDLDP